VWLLNRPGGPVAVSAAIHGAGQKFPDCGLSNNSKKCKKKIQEIFGAPPPAG
jgi:hypothetical protein